MSSTAYLLLGMGFLVIGFLAFCMSFKTTQRGKASRQVLTFPALAIGGILLVCSGFVLILISESMQSDQDTANSIRQELVKLVTLEDLEKGYYAETGHFTSDFNELYVRADQKQADLLRPLAVDGASEGQFPIDVFDSQQALKLTYWRSPLNQYSIIVSPVDGGPLWNEQLVCNADHFCSQHQWPLSEVNQTIRDSFRP